MSINMLIIGHIDDPEFAGLSDWLGGLQDVAIEQVRSLTDYWRTCGPTGDAGGASPDLILVLERHPDEHTAGDVNRLIERHPLARLICGHGPWSESAARTRGRWPAIVWTPIALVREHVLSELAVVRGERHAVAITADRADAFERWYTAPEESGGRRLASLKVAVDVQDAEYRSMLEDELLAQSAEVVDTTDQWDLLLFDAHPEALRMRELRRMLAAKSDARGRVIILHQLPCAAACEAWSGDRLGTRLEVEVVSKLAPLSALSQPRLSPDIATNWPSGSGSETS